MGVVTQMGNQGTSEDGLREAVEVIRSGAIGDVSEVHIWSNRPVWPQGVGRPEGEDPIPEDLNWDAWIGPAPMRPFKKGVYHSFNWRGWVDFGTGALGDMACHTTNMPVMALELWDPIAVTAVKNPGIFEGETFPGSSSLMFEFPKRGNLPPCNFYWYDGGNLPDDDLISQLPAGFQKRIQEQREGGRKTSGAVVVGSKGLLFSPDDYGAQYYLLPEDNYKDFKKPEQSLPRIPFKAGGDQRQKWEFVSTDQRRVRTRHDVELRLCRSLDRNDPGRQPRHASRRRPAYRVGREEPEEHERARRQRIRSTRVPRRLVDLVRSTSIT